MGSGVTLFDFDFGLYARIPATTITYQKWLIKVNRNRMLCTQPRWSFPIFRSNSNERKIARFRNGNYVFISWLYILWFGHGCRLDTLCVRCAMYLGFFVFVAACMRACSVRLCVRALDFASIRSSYIVKGNVAKCTYFFLIRACTTMYYIYFNFQHRLDSNCQEDAFELMYTPVFIGKNIKNRIICIYSRKFTCWSSMNKKWLSIHVGAMWCVRINAHESTVITFVRRTCRKNGIAKKGI